MTPDLGSWDSMDVVLAWANDDPEIAELLARGTRTSVLDFLFARMAETPDGQASSQHWQKVTDLVIRASTDPAVETVLRHGSTPDLLAFLDREGVTLADVALICKDYQRIVDDAYGTRFWFIRPLPPGVGEAIGPYV
ncbi:MAG: hypothetical protein M3220_09250 [Chloroflexota bacterium]|nr:hypothetical protein [Chloroflexota bacterium]